MDFNVGPFPNTTTHMHALVITIRAEEKHTTVGFYGEWGGGGNLFFRLLLTSGARIVTWVVLAPSKPKPSPRLFKGWITLSAG